MVVRPSTAQLRKAVLLAIPALALAVLPSLGDDTGWKILGAILIVILIPLVVVLVMLWRNKRLAQRGESLVYVDWRGREHLIPGSDIATAGFVMIPPPAGGAPDQRLIVERHSEAPPLVVSVGMWDKFEIRQLLAGLGVEVEPFELTVTRAQLVANLPGYRPPLVERHPAAVGLLGTAVVLAVFVGLVFAVVVLTE